MTAPRAAAATTQATGASAAEPAPAPEPAPAGRTRAGRPRLSVVVPAYNEQAHLGRTLDGLLAQRIETTYEIVVVDNASTDETASIARSRGARVVREDRRGVCAARQRGTEEALGDIVVSTDADTLHPAGWLSRIVGAFDADPDLVAVGGPCRYLDGPLWTRIAPPLLFGLLGRWHALSGRTTYLTATNVAFRRAGFPGYDTTLTQGGDEVDLLRRLRRLGRVGWDAGNPVLTSARRLDQGLLHTLFVSYGWYYLGARVTHRLRGATVMPLAPAVRAGQEGDSARLRRRWQLAALVVAAGIALARRRTR